MPFSYSISTQSELVEISGTGSADFESLAKLMTQLISHPEFKSHFSILADFSGLSYIPTFKEIRQFGALFQTVSKAFLGKVAFVVSHPAQLNAGRFASVIARAIRFQMNVFAGRAEALAWIAPNKEVQVEDIRQKIAGVIEPFQLAALATVRADGTPWVRYVTVRGDDHLVVRFATPMRSRKVAEIRANPNVHLTCGCGELASAKEWVQIVGRARVTSDDEIRKSFWEDFLSAWFNGPDDSEYAVVEVIPSRIEYLTMDSLIPRVLEL
ncbi:MAG: pyridoxamine 5'-phosphate oxidase family protein [Deltaproteobacteria bacterium]|nr:pyridoxamine 5'-phosphate oxidase family protein [Deltaproteobacteria bacterium]